MFHIRISVHYDTTGYSTSEYPYITMKQDVPHQYIRKLRCNRMFLIEISAHYDATECPTSRYPHITMQQDVPHQDIRTLRCNSMFHIKISVHYDETGCPTSIYPHISMQQNVPHHDDYSPFLQRPLDQLHGRMPNCRRCKPLTSPTLSFASPSLPNSMLSVAAAL